MHIHFLVNKKELVSIVGVHSIIMLGHSVLTVLASCTKTRACKKKIHKENPQSLLWIPLIVFLVIYTKYLLAPGNNTSMDTNQAVQYQ
jgi:hypothetical protein